MDQFVAKMITTLLVISGACGMLLLFHMASQEQEGIMLIGIPFTALISSIGLLIIWIPDDPERK